MKPTLTLLAMLLMAGCGKKAQQNESPQQDYKWIDKGGDIYEINIDGCQYLKHERFGNGTIIHKANCTNPIHEKIK